MTAITLHTTPIDPLNQIITLLESLRPRLPFADEELAHHLQLRAILAEQQERSAVALAAWRAALALRWECEVRAQRLYDQLYQQTIDFIKADSRYTPLLEAVTSASTLTATDLLTSLQQLAALLSLIQPPPPFVEPALTEIQTVANALQAAIAQTEQCAEQRRQAQAEQRLLNDLCRQAYRRTRTRIAAHLNG